MEEEYLQKSTNKYLEKLNVTDNRVKYERPITENQRKVLIKENISQKITSNENFITTL